MVACAVDVERQNVYPIVVGHKPQTGRVGCFVQPIAARKRHALLWRLSRRRHLVHVDCIRQLVPDDYLGTGGCWCEAGRGELAVTAAVESGHVTACEQTTQPVSVSILSVLNFTRLYIIHKVLEGCKMVVFMSPLFIKLFPSILPLTQEDDTFVCQNMRCCSHVFYMLGLCRKR